MRFIRVTALVPDEQGELRREPMIINVNAIECVHRLREVTTIELRGGPNTTRALTIADELEGVASLLTNVSGPAPSWTSNGARAIGNVEGHG